LLKIKASLKGYELDGKNIVAPISGGSTSYLKMSYDGAEGGSYTVRTCSQDDFNPGIWHVVVSTEPIFMENIYGANLEIWDFGGNPIRFYDGYSTFDVYLSLTTKITVDGPNLKKASVKGMSCGVWGELDNGHNVLGSCKLSGARLAADKAPVACQ
jgi:hypothetical protein